MIAKFDVDVALPGQTEKGAALLMEVSLDVVGPQPVLPEMSSAEGLSDSVRRSIRRTQLFFPPMVVPKLQSRQTSLFPLGLGYIGSVLEGEGMDVCLVDCATEGYDTLIDIGKDRIVYGLTREQIRQRIVDYKPDLVAVSALFSTLEKRMLMIAEIVKEVDPNIVVVAGGPHASAFYERIIRNPAVDYCVIGEGEEIIAHLLHALNGSYRFEDIGGLCWRNGGSVVIQKRTSYIENLDNLALPGRHLVDMETYFRIAEPQGLRLDGERKYRSVTMTTSRGCPFQCTYCGKDVTWGKSYRTHGVKYVLDEMEHLIETYGAEYFAFQDDNFTADMDRAAAIFDGIVERGFKIGWEAPNGLGVNFLSPSLLEKMRASGCESFTIAVESANDATLRRVRKPNYITLAPPITQKAKELGITVRGFFMIGFPGETLQEVMRTVEYARQLDLAVTNFAIVTPLPGTPLYTDCVEAGMIDPETVDFEDFAYGAFDLQLAEVPVDELKSIRKAEWMRTMFLDKHGLFRSDSGLKKSDVIDEITTGMESFPDNKTIHQIHEAAMLHFAE